MLLKLITIVCFLFVSTHIEAQLIDEVEKKQKDTMTTWQMIKYDTKTTLQSVSHAFSRPLHWKGKNYKDLAFLLTGSAVLSLADHPSRDFFRRNAEDFPGGLRDFGWYFGSPQNYFMVNAGLYGYGLLTKNEKIRKVSVLIISSSITTGLIQTFTKNAIGRARPETGFDNLTFEPFANDAGFRAFPSGHTVLSVTMAHSIAKQFDNVWVKAGIYTIGAIPPISRLVDDAHWVTDIAFSTVLSILVVDTIDNFLFGNDKYEYSKKEKKISWNIGFGGNTIGIIGTF